MTCYLRTLIVCNMLPDPTGDGLTQVKPPLAETPKTVSSQWLLGERRELRILHNGREYRLRLTQHGKLILTA